VSTEPVLGHAPGPFGLNDLDFPGFRPELGACAAAEVHFARADDDVTIAYPVAWDGSVTMVVGSP